MIRWAGWLTVFYGTAHTLGAFTAEGAAQHVGAWFSGELWGADFANMSPAMSAYWLSVNSFGPPLIVVGLLVLWLDRRGHAATVHCVVVHRLDRARFRGRRAGRRAGPDSSGRLGTAAGRGRRAAARRSTLRHPSPWSPAPSDQSRLIDQSRVRSRSSRAGFVSLAGFVSAAGTVRSLLKASTGH